VQALLNTAGLDQNAVVAIGNHGQTIRHRPRLGHDQSFSLQIGDAHFLAEASGIKVVADFRSRDICLGGQGAPLVPGFHQAVFANEAINRCVLNIGGIANATYLPTHGAVAGFDTGPGNGLMDSWIQHCLQRPFDTNGDWAASGNLHNELLDSLLKHPFLALTPPKSTGREEFTLSWLQAVLAAHAGVEPRDVQRTLLEYSAVTISDAVKKYCAEVDELYVCGGGINNTLLRERLAALVQAPVYSTEILGVDPQWVEAMAFAWLAKQCLDGLPGNIPSVTGASQAVVLGAIYTAGTIRTQRQTLDGE
jgi:anhydro-N-acetylmuramic acid kinase